MLTGGTVNCGSRRPEACVLQSALMPRWTRICQCPGKRYQLQEGRPALAFPPSLGVQHVPARDTSHRLNGSQWVSAPQTLSP
ncbi:hypothetical protein H8959_015708 [Pygathrix nigripes]